MDIRIIEFKQEHNPVTQKLEDWILYAATDSIQSAQTWEKVSSLNPETLKSKAKSRDKQGLREAHIRAKWEKIEPAYRLWKQGHEIPEVGTSLGVWPAITSSQRMELALHGLKTVEDVAEMSEAVLQKLTLPAPRKLRDQAVAFLENARRADADASLMTANRRAENAEKEAQETKEAMAELMERLAALEAKPKRGRPAKQEAEAA